MPVYLEPVQGGNKNWPADTIVDGIPDIENITDALKTSRYGQCVYECDNDVCDNQVGFISLGTQLEHSPLLLPKDRQPRIL